MKDDSSKLPENKFPYPTRTGDAPFQQLQKLLELDRASIWKEARREVKAQAVRKLELLDEMHKELVQKAQKILEKAQLDLQLHSITMHSAKIRGRMYYLYELNHSDQAKFFSILEPAEYEKANPDARYLGTYRLNEDSTWTRLDPSGEDNPD